MTTIKRMNAGDRAPGEGNNSGGDGIPSMPIDMRLMLYADGELDAAGREEIEALLKKNADARRKLRGLRITSSVVRERALATDLGGDIASSVMAAIDAGIEAKPAQAQGGAKPITLLDARGAGSGRERPANDNSRGIFVLTAIAVAAAAVMMVWGRMGAEPPQKAASSAPIMTQAALVEPPQKASAEEVAAAPPSPQDVDSEHGVEVAAVDFGAHMGTIFYVPAGTAVSNATTTVVWVDDEVAGGK